LREEHSLGVFENRVLRTIFGPKRDEVTREWRRLHNNELYVFYTSPNFIRVIKSRRLRWAGHVARMGRVEVRTGFWWGEPDGRRLLERPKRRWKNNIKMDLRKKG
jgi:acyl-coenzyme A synthetase/AMP-(fatty) acid ligase